MNIWDYFVADPVTELYKFSHGSEVFCYAATSEKTYLFNKHSYAPEYIVRTQMHYSSDFAKDSLTVTVPATNAVASIFMAGTPEHQLGLTVYRGGYHAGEFIPIWIGDVVGANFNYNDDTYSCDLSCETAAARMERRGLPRCYQLSCPYALYDAHCGVVRHDYTIVDKVYSTSGFDVQVMGSYADDYFAGGQIVLIDDSRRYITGNKGNVLTLDRIIPLVTNVDVLLQPGCDKSRTTCAEKFDNVLNYGGFPWLPVTDPFRAQIG